MSEIRGFLTAVISDRRQRRIVTILTLVIGLIAVWSPVDEYFAVHEERLDLVNQLEVSQSEAAELPYWEDAVKERVKAASALGDRLVTSNELNATRTELSALIRKNELHLRHLEAGEGKRRPWNIGDDPMAPLDLRTPEAEFELITETVSLSAVGTVAQVSQLIADVEEMKKLMHIKQATIRNDLRSDYGVTIELVLSFHHLVRAKKRIAA